MDDQVTAWQMSAPNTCVARAAEVAALWVECGRILLGGGLEVESYASVALIHLPTVAGETFEPMVAG